MNTTKKVLGKKKFFISFLIALFLVFSNYLYCGTNKNEQSVTHPDITYLDITYSNSVIRDNIYINWILNHSYRISRQTATGIYNTAMSTNSGLLLLAIASRESSFSPTAISNKGAIGINQIMPNIWVKELQEQGIIKERKDLFDYDKNLLASNYILTKYYNALGSWEKALQKYVGKNHKTYAKDVFAIYGELQLINNI